MSILLKSIGTNQTEIQMTGKFLFFSYETLVAALVDGTYYRADPKTVNKWSKTTSKHVNSWCPPNAEVVSYSELMEIANG